MTLAIPSERALSSLVLGTRGSHLALAQAHWVESRLASGLPPIRADIRIVKTTGDRALSASLASGESVGWFVREIEDELLVRRIDLAVHSLKDLPLAQPDGLILAAIPAREDARDVLVTRDGRSLPDLEPGARIGTGSPRRIGQLLALRPDLRFEAIRGNVDTRLRKLSEGRVDALVLALAGLNRLGVRKTGAAPLPFETMLPAPGQGALALEIRASDRQLGALLRQRLDHAESAAAVRAERAFLQSLGGGCQMPVGALARVFGDALEVEGVVASPDGARILRDAVRGALSSPEEAGEALGRRMLDQGAGALLS